MVSNFKDTKVAKTLFVYIVKCCSILFGGGIIGILLLTIVYLFPVNSAMKESSFMHYDFMGWTPLVNNRYTQYQSFFSSFEPGILDDITDKIILSNSFDESEESALKRAINMNNYGRYWHGYVSILRPIFYFVDYWDFLLINSFLQLFLMGCVGYGIFKVTRQKRYLLAFASSCIFLTPAATGMSLQYSPVFYISMLGSLVCLLKTDWILQKYRRYYLFLILGIITCYFDFLTYPLLSFAFPFCWLLVAAGKKINLKSQLQLLFGGGFSFIFGYGGFFFTKWGIQAIILGKDIFLNGFSAVALRLGDTEDTYSLLHQSYSRLDVLYNNFRHYLFPFFIVVISIWLIVFLYNFLRNGMMLVSDNIIFAAVTLTSPAWYLILNNHAAYHHLFTYRIYGASLLGFMLFVCGTFKGKLIEYASIRTYAMRLALLSLCLVIGVLFSRLAKEDITTLNGGEHTELQLSEGDLLEFEFTPSIDTIKGFNFCIHTNSSSEGHIQVDICDSDLICETTLIPLSKYKPNAFDYQLTDWNLKAGKQYVMKISLKDNTSGVRILVTPEGCKIQEEYGAAFFNQEYLADVAPLSGIVYRGNVQSIPIKLYLAFCTSIFFLVMLLSTYVFFKKRLINQIHH